MQVLAFRSVLQAWWGYSVLQGLEPSLKKVRLPQNMRLLQELVRCKNSCQLYKSMIQIQKPSRAEGRKPADSPKMMPCSIKVRRDWRLEVGYWLQEVIMWFLWFFMVLLIYCYVCLCALFISSFDLMWRAAKSLRIIPEQDDKLTHLGVYCSCIEAILGSRSSGHLSASCRTTIA